MPHFSRTGATFRSLCGLYQQPHQTVGVFPLFIWTFGDYFWNFSFLFFTGFLMLSWLSSTFSFYRSSRSLFWKCSDWSSQLNHATFPSFIGQWEARKYYENINKGPKGCNGGNGCNRCTAMPAIRGSATAYLLTWPPGAPGAPSLPPSSKRPAGSQ